MSESQIEDFEKALRGFSPDLHAAAKFLVFGGPYELSQAYYDLDHAHSAIITGRLDKFFISRGWTTREKFDRYWNLLDYLYGLDQYSLTREKVCDRIGS